MLIENCHCEAKPKQSHPFEGIATHPSGARNDSKGKPFECLYRDLGFLRIKKEALTRELTGVSTISCHSPTPDRSRGHACSENPPYLVIPRLDRGIQKP